MVVVTDLCMIIFFGDQFILSLKRVKNTHFNMSSQNNNVVN